MLSDADKRLGKSMHKDFCQASQQSTVMSAAERALGIKMLRAR